jgi:NADPH:quinone reductase-like Zn-dependent oxidoreductase
MSQIILNNVGNLPESATLVTEPNLTVGERDVLVAIEAANINPGDFLYAVGWYGLAPTVGNRLGNEGVGHVVEVGSGVDVSLVGRRVIILPNTEQGTWADQVVVSVDNVVPVGDKGDSVQLAQLSVNPFTAHTLLTRFGSLKEGDWVGQTIGNGAVGQYVIQLAKRAGYKTISIVRSENAAEQVRAAGGDLVLLEGENLSARVAEALNGAQLSLALDGEGGTTIGELAQSLQFGGTVVAYSSATGAPQAIGIADVIYRNIKLEGWWIVNALRQTPRAELESTYEMLSQLAATGEISSTVEATYALSDYREALTHAATTARSGKVLFTFDTTK